MKKYRSHSPGRRPRNKRKLEPFDFAMLAIGGYCVYQWFFAGNATTAPNQGDPATMNTSSLNPLPGLPSMQGYEAVGGCGCKRKG